MIDIGNFYYLYTLYIFHFHHNEVNKTNYETIFHHHHRRYHYDNVCLSSPNSLQLKSNIRENLHNDYQSPIKYVNSSSFFDISGKNK